MIEAGDFKASTTRLALDLYQLYRSDLIAIASRIRPHIACAESRLNTPALRCMTTKECPTTLVWICLFAVGANLLKHGVRQMKCAHEVHKI